MSVEIIGEQRNGETDAVLAARARRRDAGAFGLLLTRHWATAVRVAARTVNDRDDVADILQEAALAAYLNVDSLLSPERFQGWFCGIVLNYCRMYHRRRSRTPRVQPLDEAEPSPAAGVEAVVEGRLLLASVREAVESLPPAQRQAALLVYFEGWDPSEAAAALGVSPGALKVRLHRVRRALRSRFAEKAGRSTPKARRCSMVEVDVYDVHVPNREEETPPEVQAVVVLKEKDGERLLPIWIGEGEGTAIALQLESQKVPRPLTHDLTKSLLDAAQVKVESVAINKLVKDTFYAVVSIRTGGRASDIDARPSDAINLALRTSAPLFVEESVFEASPGKARPAQPERTGSAAFVSRRAEAGRAATGKLPDEGVRDAWRDLGIEFEED